MMKRRWLEERRNKIKDLGSELAEMKGEILWKVSPPMEIQKKDEDNMNVKEIPLTLGQWSSPRETQKTRREVTHG